MLAILLPDVFVRLRNHFLTMRLLINLVNKMERACHLRATLINDPLRSKFLARSQNYRGGHCCRVEICWQRAMCSLRPRFHCLQIALQHFRPFIEHRDQTVAEFPCYPERQRSVSRNINRNLVFDIDKPAIQMEKTKRAGHAIEGEFDFLTMQQSSHHSQILAE